MRHENPPDDQIRELLTRVRTIAVVGASSDRTRTSNSIMKRLMDHGYTVIPVNPNEREVHGQRAFARLSDVPVSVDLVNVFRRPEYTPSIAHEAVQIHARGLWLQQGVWNEEAAAIATAGGLVVVMDQCIAVMLSLLGVPPIRGHK